MIRAKSWGQALIDRLRTESGSALLLIAVATVAMIWANSPWSESYTGLFETHAAVSFGSFAIDLSLHHWVNDGLMVIFFFLIGLEVRQEFAVGSLRDRRRALVPLLAGLVGVALPAGIFLLIAGRTDPSGWGIVIGTDTAFLLGALALVGPKLSSQLRVFLLTLTVVDDFLAVAIIGIFYTENLRVAPLLLAAVCLLLLFWLGRAQQWRSGPYVFVIVVLWAATLLSGVHPSLAGMAAGLLVPAAATERGRVVDAKNLFRDYWQSPGAGAARQVQRGLARSISVNQRLHEVLRGPVSMVIVPIFALANAGVDLRGGVLGDALTSPITWGVVAGLVIGKFVGISLGTWLAVRLGLGSLPQGVGPGSVAGGAALSGIGFTMSLLIISLSLEGELADQATVGVLLAMGLSWTLGWLVFRIARDKLGETDADLPSVLTPAFDPELDHSRGSADASHILVEYLDFECPFCARSTGMWNDLRQHFGDDIRYVVRHLPLDDYHPRARAAALVSEAAADQGKFWQMHDLLFANQAHLSDEDLWSYAEQLGLDLERFAADLASGRLEQRLARHEESANASGAMGTPTFYVNGHRHRGSHDARFMIADLESGDGEPGRRRS